MQWNGKDDRGTSVASSVYFYQLRASGIVIDTKKNDSGKIADFHCVTPKQFVLLDDDEFSDVRLGAA